MSRRWENKEVPGRGTKFCLVIDPEDGTHEIRTYGWSEAEVLDKVAHTAETAQATINRLRATATTTPVSSSLPTIPSGGGNGTRSTAGAPRPLTSAEQMQATADLSDPAKSPDAVKTLLRGVGVDVDQMKLDEDIKRVASLAQEWAKQRTDYPVSDRNNRLLLDKATLMVGFSNITAAALDAAYRELVIHEMLFEADETSPPPASNGNSATRERGRTATTYRSSTLRTEPVVTTTKPKYTRAEIDALNSRQLREKIEHEPGFKDWYDREFSRAAQ
jgi:hypothetical protein